MFSFILHFNRRHYISVPTIYQIIFNILNMGIKLLTIFVLFTLFYFAYARFTRPKTVYVCEGKTLELSCEYNEGIIVIHATYGRKNPKICTEDLEEEEGSPVEMNLDCRSRNATSILKQKCFFKRNCSIEINNDLFGDSCPGTPKYSFVKYRCNSKERYH